MKYFIVLAAVFAMIASSGCSHNCVTYSDGIGFDTTINPQTYTFGLNFRYGKILSVVARENTEFQLSGKGGIDSAVVGQSANSPAAQSDAAIKLKIGRQITGYYVDAITAGATPKQLKDYISEATDK